MEGGAPNTCLFPVQGQLLKKGCAVQTQKFGSHAQVVFCYSVGATANAH